MTVYVVLATYKDYIHQKHTNADILGVFYNIENADECKHENRYYYGDIEIKETTLS